jgi:hypothetical protein
MLEAWKQFIAGQPLGSEPSKAILESWERCKAFEIETARAHLRRVPLTELTERIARAGALVAAAKKHLVWALASIEPVSPVIVMLTDRDGIILHSVSNAPEAMAAFGLIPGYDWSERAMGTNGIGTAISLGAPIAVVGSEHYIETWHNNTCVGSPVRGPDGEICGAVDICTMATDGDPARLVFVAFLAHVVGLELGRPADPRYAEEAVLERASAGGTKRPDLEEGARALAFLEHDLLQNARDDRPDDDRKPTAIGTVLERIAGVRDHAPPLPASIDLAAPQLFERGLTHLAHMLRRQGGGQVDLSTTLENAMLIVSLEGNTPELSPANSLDRAGVALGEWLTRQLLAVSEATLEREDTNGRTRYVVRLRAR